MSCQVFFFFAWANDRCCEIWGWRVSKSFFLPVCVMIRLLYVLMDYCIEEKIALWNTELILQTEVQLYLFNNYLKLLKQHIFLAVSSRICNLFAKICYNIYEAACHFRSKCSHFKLKKDIIFNICPPPQNMMDYYGYNKKNQYMRIKL